jgi:hypothetical protein
MSKEGTTKKESATPGTERKSRVGSLDFCCWRPFAAMFLRIEFFSFDEGTTKCKSARTVVEDYKPFRENLRLNRCLYFLTVSGTFPLLDEDAF